MPTSSTVVTAEQPQSLHSACQLVRLRLVGAESSRTVKTVLLGAAVQPTLTPWPVCWPVTQQPTLRCFCNWLKQMHAEIVLECVSSFKSTSHLGYQLRPRGSSTLRLPSTVPQLLQSAPSGAGSCFFAGQSQVWIAGSFAAQTHDTVAAFMSKYFKAGHRCLRHAKTDKHACCLGRWTVLLLSVVVRSQRLKPGSLDSSPIVCCSKIAEAEAWVAGQFSYCL